MTSQYLKFHMAKKLPLLHLQPRHRPPTPPPPSTGVTEQGLVTDPHCLPIQGAELW